jgi:hypothetical protein
MKASGEIPPFRKPDDPDVECYNPSKVIKAYNPQFVRAECAQERWTDRHFQWLMDYLYPCEEPGVPEEAKAGEEYEAQEGEGEGEGAGAEGLGEVEQGEGGQDEDLRIGAVGVEDEGWEGEENEPWMPMEEDIATWREVPPCLSPCCEFPRSKNLFAICEATCGACRSQY